MAKFKIISIIPNIKIATKAIGYGFFLNFEPKKLNLFAIVEKFLEK